jgi:hypothetical protein
MNETAKAGDTKIRSYSSGLQETLIFDGSIWYGEGSCSAIKQRKVSKRTLDACDRAKRQWKARYV